MASSSYYQHQKPHDDYTDPFSEPHQAGSEGVQYDLKGNEQPYMDLTQNDVADEPFQSHGYDHSYSDSRPPFAEEPSDAELVHNPARFSRSGYQDLGLPTIPVSAHPVGLIEV
jgi:hypothetical protein